MYFQGPEVRQRFPTPAPTATAVSAEVPAGGSLGAAGYDVLAEQLPVASPGGGWATATAGVPPAVRVDMFRVDYCHYLQLGLCDKVVLCSFLCVYPLFAESTTVVVGGEGVPALESD